jgi:SAM-dependent methyltransferase
MSEYIKSEYQDLAENPALQDNRDSMRLSGYTEEQLDCLPSTAMMGLACGSPVTACDLKPGMKYLDLGCGAGADVILAGLKVQPGGVSIGLDFLPEMILRAKSNLAQCPVTLSETVRFDVRDISSGSYEFENEYFDYISSNCSVCLVNQANVFHGVFRILKPGGSFVFSEVGYKREWDAVPADLYRCIKTAMERGITPANDASISSKVFRIYVTLVKDNAIEEELTYNLLREAGFTAVNVIERRPQAYDPAERFQMKSDRVPRDEVDRYTEALHRAVKGVDVNDYMSYLTIEAKK